MPTIFNPNKRKGIFMIPAGATKSPTAADLFPNTNSLAFDGVDETVNLGNVTALNGLTSASFSMWLKVNSTGIEGIMNQWGGSSDRLIYAFIWLANGRIDIYISGYRSFNVNSNAIINALSTGQWFNLVITYDGSQAAYADRVKVYIDNQELTGNISYAPTSLNNPTTDFILGTYPSGTYLDGNMDEFAIFTNTLTTDNINDIYNGGTPNDLTSLSPVLWYRNGDNSTFKSPQILMPENENKNKLSNYSLSMDGVDDFVSIYDGTSGSGPIQFTASSDFTISAWIKTSSLSAQNQILSFRGTALIWFYTSSSSGNIRANLYMRDNSSNFTIISTFNNSTGWITADTWTNIIVTRNGTTKELNIYLNGTQAQTTTTDTTTDDFTLYDKLSIGNDNFSGGRYWYTGQIDEVSIFDSVVDVSSIYNSGEPTTISGALAHWRMGEQATFSTNWTVPDQVGSNDGTSANMTVEDRIGDAANSSNNAVSYNMEEADISNDTP